MPKGDVYTRTHLQGGRRSDEVGLECDDRALTARGTAQFHSKIQQHILGDFGDGVRHDPKGRGIRDKSSPAKLQGTRELSGTRMARVHSRVEAGLPPLYLCSTSRARRCWFRLPITRMMASRSL